MKNPYCIFPAHSVLDTVLVRILNKKFKIKFVRINKTNTNKYDIRYDRVGSITSVKKNRENTGCGLIRRFSFLLSQSIYEIKIEIPGFPEGCTNNQQPRVFLDFLITTKNIENIENIFIVKKRDTRFSSSLTMCENLCQE
jgi:hypothetical protein